ncbi:Shedu anti-phage system protein SduA domain-containing protein [Neisseria dumasiana]|uniref:Shedu protein SduA C-terminal domain-containing protein n=1 Tax=Neisseria dumasiana TaxID=1931275 RepID=A0ABX3WP70_9NEIS|nr:Shedu anti-phage system protein SduA domain-containing protein [Neisseria dumasiana]OSI35549.1 hypothetical protein BV913_04925 [Neisseria dumasiana]UOO84258.1 DUF4263 domain-containing protein [Neisseria dumasiana]
MKILDFVFDFGKPSSGIGGLCRVRSYVTSNHDEVITFLTELDKNDGQSVTNAIELIIQKLINEKGFGDHIFIEHYERDNNTDTFDKVIIENKLAKWISLNKTEIKNIIGFNNFLDLSNDRSSLNHRIRIQADQIRLQRNPWIDSPYPKSDAFIARKLLIEKNMKSKKDLINLIEQGYAEQEILAFLKQDLSFFGEVYANPEDEYIVFSEYPVEKGSKSKDGFVDFVLFTGRSRMDVILIEVKGANFNLFNQSGYGQPHADISKAEQQIRDRLRAVYYEDMPVFRRKCHIFRGEAENGKLKLKNYLVGAEGKLYVDPNKEIKIRTVIIGGRTQNDREESLERHKFEESHTIPITLESWDTWIRKLKREN